MSDFGLYVTSDFCDDELYADEEVKIEPKKEKSGSGKKFRIIKIFFWVFLSFVIGEFLWYKVGSPLFHSPQITFSGYNTYSPEELCVKLLSMNSTNWLDFDCEEAASILSSEAGIESVTVSKKFPSHIYINVTERTPVAITFVDLKGYTTPVQIDKSGTLFPEHEGKKTDKSNLPIVSGIPVEFMASGMKIPLKYRTLIEQISKIHELPQNYFAGISEISVITKDSGNYELEIIPSQSKVKVLTDRSLNEDAIKYMMLVLDVVNKLSVDATTVDLRYGSVSYRTSGDL